MRDKEGGGGERENERKKVNYTCVRVESTIQVH